MKKSTMVVAIVALVAVFAIGQVVQAAIEGSAHDFAALSWSGEICQPCHTPHNGNNSTSPLWNHEITAVASYIMYDNATTMDADMSGNPAGETLLCLSCHDGSVALDNFGGATGGTNFIAASADVASGGGNNDLSASHPVSFTYNSALATADGELVDPSADADADVNTVGAAAASDLPLFGGQLECATCHDVHDADVVGGGLLRYTNVDSALCMTCHNK